MIESKKMLALPLNGRSYIDLLGLQAGVAPDSAGTIGGDRQVSGGVSAGLIPNLDSIEEFRLITNSFDAEYGKFSGAMMNAITKSGANAIHGDAFEFLRNDTMDARNFFVASESELRLDLTHNFVASYNWALPFDRAFSKLPKRLAQGWNITGITRFSMGFPIHISQSHGDLSLTGSSSTEEPNLMGPVVIQNPRQAGPNIFNHTQFNNPNGELQQQFVWSRHRRPTAAHRASKRKVFLVSAEP